MKLVENPAKVGRIVLVVVVIAIAIQIVNFLSYFSNSSGDKSTTLNSLIMYILMGIILIAIIFAVAIGVMNRAYRSKLQSGQRASVQPSSSDSSVVVGGTDEPASAGVSSTNNGHPSA
jgi:hypothetical protein